LQYRYEDALDNLTQVIYGDGTTKEMTYRASDNRLGTVKLASGETMTYDYTTAGQIRSQVTRNAAGVETDRVEYTYENGKVKTMSDRTGTTTYRYDTVTSALKGIDKPNGSGVEYSYDLMGRMKTLSEWTGLNKPRYITTYDYDGFGNLKSVLDPTGGLTTMKYDVVNRLEERSLPNDVKTSYEYDDLDRVKKITHTNTVTNQVLSSVTYEREGIGEPTKITREDGTYVKLKYDDSLRVEKESYYDANSVLVEEISYTYDGTGKRTSKRDRFGTENYNYKAGFQLDTISGASSENYDFDANGRLTLIERDGKTIDLEHDAGDRLAQVKNVTDNKTTQYTYDGAGNRVRAIEGSDVRQFLVAPAMGSGLESSEAIGDASGNLMRNYVYAGGNAPFMMLDANGNPTYYLMDAMGTVIGLADTTGQEVADFRYDAFGNDRGATGSAANSGNVKGDFRFQGQWLESESGIYYFRARDYDAQIGTFISRDPLDIIETEPESMNPYQFVYNNPHMYSDPTGMFSMIEVNASINIQDILREGQRQVIGQAKEYILDQARGVAGSLVQQALSPLLPDLWMTNIMDRYTPGNQGTMLDAFVRDQVCAFFGGRSGRESLVDRLWFNPEIDSAGKPHSDGFNCSSPNGEFLGNFDPRYPNPDFLFKKRGPEAYDKNPKGWLVGDIKLNMRRLHSDVTSGNKDQWLAIANWANYKNGHQYSPFTFFIVWKDNGVTGTREELQREALSKNVFMYVLSIFD
jgi:RHS repeat-associated protein